MVELVKKNPIDVPQSLVEQQRRIGRAGDPGSAPAPGGRVSGLADDSARRFRPTREVKVRAGLLMAEVAKKEGVQVTDTDIEDGIKELAEQSGEEHQQGTRGGRIARSSVDKCSSARILENKVLDIIQSKAKIEEGMSSMSKRPENRADALATLKPLPRATDLGHSIIYPHVVETTHRGERTWDIFSRLLKDRIVFLGSAIDDDVANIVIAQFLFSGERRSGQGHPALRELARRRGHRLVSAIYDTMQYVRCPVSTICIGQAASMGALLLGAGQKGRRFALPNSRIMIHQPLGGARGQATDIEIQAREIRHTARTWSRTSSFAPRAEPRDDDRPRYRARFLHGPRSSQRVRAHRRVYRAEEEACWFLSRRPEVRFCPPQPPDTRSARGRTPATWSRPRNAGKRVG